MSLTLGIIGTALGAWALFGNRRSAGDSILGGAGGGMLGDGSTNINVLGATAGINYTDRKTCNVIYGVDSSLFYLSKF